MYGFHAKMQIQNFENCALIFVLNPNEKRRMGNSHAAEYVLNGTVALFAATVPFA